MNKEGYTTDYMCGPLTVNHPGGVDLEAPLEPLVGYHHQLVDHPARRTQVEDLCFIYIAILQD